MSGQEPAPSLPSSPVEQPTPPSSEPKERGEPKPEVRLETWRRWARFVLDNIRERNELRELHAAAERERISRKRVDSILAVLEEAGLVVVEEEQARLSEKHDVVSAAMDVEKLRRELAAKETELSSLRGKLVELEAELGSLKAGVRSVQCQRLKALDIEGYSGQRLFYCALRRLSMGERAEICLACDERVPVQGQPAAAI